MAGFRRRLLGRSGGNVPDAIDIQRRGQVYSLNRTPITGTRPSENLLPMPAPTSYIIGSKVPVLEAAVPYLKENGDKMTVWRSYTRGTDMAELGEKGYLPRWSDNYWVNLAMMYKTAKPEDKKEIRLLFEAYYQPYLEQRLLSILIKHHGSPKAEDLLNRGEEWVNARVFSPGAFLNMIKQYNPTLGCIDRFIKKKIVWRCLDFTKGPGAITEDPPDVFSAREKIITLRPMLDRLQKQKYKGIPCFGKQTRAVFDLFYVALVRPDEISQETLSLVESVAEKSGKKVKATISQLKDEHQQACKRFDEFETIYQKAWVSRCKALEELKQAEATLNINGQPYEPECFEQLQYRALCRTISDIEDEKRKSSNDPTKQDELEYMVCYLRFIQANDHFETKRQRYENISDRVWHRSQSDVASYIGLTQSVVSRRLAQGWDFITHWGEQLRKRRSSVP